MKKRCPYCHQEMTTMYQFENSIPISDSIEHPLINAYSRSLRETLIDVPFIQSLISGCFIGTSLGLTATWFMNSFSYTDLRWYISIPMGVFLSVGVDWLKRSREFNTLLWSETVESENNEDSSINVTVKAENGRQIKRGDITSATHEQLIKWSKTILTDLKINRYALTETGGLKADLTISRFTTGPTKLFSQPAYTKFMEQLTVLSIVERINKNAKNSPYHLTKYGLNFINQWSNYETTYNI